MDGHSYKCVSLHQNPPCTNASQCIRDPCARSTLWAIMGTGTMQPERNFPEQYKGNSGKRFLSWLGYTLARGGCQECVSRRFSKVLEPLVFFSQKQKSLVTFPPKNVRGKKGYLGAP